MTYTTEQVVFKVEVLSADQTDSRTAAYMSTHHLDCGGHTVLVEPREAVLLIRSETQETATYVHE